MIKSKDKKEILMKNNELIKARYSLSVVENRIFMLMLFKLQKSPNGDMMCEIPRSEFRKVTKKTNNLTVRGVSNILEELLSKKISFKILNEDGQAYEWNRHNLINGYGYNKTNDSFKIYCSQMIYDLLMSYFEIDKNDNKIFKGHTPINLQIYFLLENTMSQRMYELLRLWSKSKNTVTYEIDEIKELLMIEDKYSKYNDFKKYIIIPSVNMLNKVKAFDVSYKENKTGRKVTSISFNVKDLDERKYFTDNTTKNANSTPQNPTQEFYIPDTSIFTNGTLLLFKRDFKEHNFKEKYLEDAFYESVAATLDKDNVNIIGKPGYNYFKQTLLERIDTLMMKDIRKNY